MQFVQLDCIQHAVFPVEQNVSVGDKRTASSYEILIHFIQFSYGSWMDSISIRLQVTEGR